MKTAEELLLEEFAVDEPPAEAAVALAAPPGLEEDPPLPRSRVLVAAGLAAFSVAWMLAGVFEGSLARVLAPAAVVVGVGAIAVAARIAASSIAELLLLPAAFVAGALAAVVLPNATGSTGTVPELVARAIDNGGLLQPPVPFDPGWRFLVVFLVALVAGALASASLAWPRAPMLLPVLPLPLVLAAGLLQPQGAEVVGGVVALVALVGAAMVVYTARVAGDSTGGRRFELRQALRGTAALVGVTVAVVALSRVDALFPGADRLARPQPEKPTIVPLEAVEDRVLFSVASTARGPWRLGVLDGYGRGGWLLPPLDPDRLVAPGDERALDGLTPSAATVRTRFTVHALEGLTLPAPPNPVTAAGAALRVDERTQVLRVSGSSPGRGYTYEVVTPVPPSGDVLRRATGTPPPEIARFTALPPAPPAIAALIRRAPVNAWERLQFLRARLYEKVVAAGAGLPVDIAPARVEAILAGSDATPYEITAAEVMLARWSGIPARIGYGFYGGEENGGAVEVRPRHGANWLEAWFPGHGWVAVIGVPPRARASLTSGAKNEVEVRPSEDLTLKVYLPLVQQDPLLLYVVVRYWLLRVAPVVGGLLLLWAFLPAFVRPLRRRHRRRWALPRGPHEQIAAAYAEFRDTANDLNAGDPYDTPLEFVERIAPDDEHLELAWLVTRAVWGDLSRGLTEEDVEAAARMSRSLRRRLTRAQTPLTRTLALASRSSLREPYDASLPNPWPQVRLRGRMHETRRALVRMLLLPRKRARRAAT